MSIGQVVKDALKLKKITQAQLAEHIGMRREDVNQKLSRGEFDERIIRGVSALSGVSYDMLIATIERNKQQDPEIEEIIEENKSLKIQIKDLKHELEKKDLIISGLEKEVKYLKMLHGIE